MPVISVIIPVYRVTSYIAETLDSVMRQTFGTSKRLWSMMDVPILRALNVCSTRISPQSVTSDSPTWALALLEMPGWALQQASM